MFVGISLLGNSNSDDRGLVGTSISSWTATSFLREGIPQTRTGTARFGVKFGAVEKQREVVVCDVKF